MGRLWMLRLLFLLLLCPLVAAAGEPDLYRAGVEAFNKGDYEQALTHFKLARVQGNRQPGLFYNLGVTFYKTGQYAQATEAFQQLADDPAWGALALYNLGLTAEADGQRQAAIDYYSRALQKAGDSKLASLAALKLKSLSLETKKALRLWYGLASVAVGYDDNAVLAQDDAIVETGETEDAFVDLYVAGGRVLTGSWKNGICLEGGGYARRYQDESAYSAAVIFAGISRNRQYDQWQTRAGLKVDADFDDDSHYATTPSLELAAERGLGNYTVGLYDALSRVDATGDYEYLTGIRNRLGTEISRRIPMGRISAGCEVEYNDRDDLYSGNEFFSYSPLRGKVKAALDYHLSPDWRFLLKGDYRVSRYPDANIQINNDASVTTEKRKDDRWNISTRGTYSLTGHLDLFGEYRHTNNNSNFPQYDYTSNQIMAGLTVAY